MKEKKWNYLAGTKTHQEHYKNCYWVFAGIYKKQVKESLLKMVPMKNKKILEVGCGNGFLGEIAKENNITITYGVDFTKSLLKHAKEKYKKVIYADVTKRLPFKNNEIDIVLLPEVIAHVKSKPKALKEIHRVLKTGGYLILTMPDRGYLEFLNKVKMLIKGRPSRKPNQHFKPLYFNDLASLVENNSFSIIKHYKTFFGSKQIMLTRKVLK